MIESKFYFPVILSSGPRSVPMYAPWVEALESLTVNDTGVAVLATDTGEAQQGLYVWDGKRWRYLVPLTVITSWILHGNDATIYIAPSQDIPIAEGTSVYLNGQLVPNLTVIHPNPHIYTVAVPPAAGGGAVSGVNGKVGNVTITGSGTISVDNTGAGIVINGADVLDEGVF